MTKAERKLEQAEDLITQAQYVLDAAVAAWPDDEIAADALTRAARTVLNSYYGDNQ